MLEADLAQAYDLGLRGDFEAVDRAIVAVSAERSARARAWWCALVALRWFALPESAGFPQAIVAELERLIDADAAPRSIAARAVAHWVRASALAFDFVQLARATSLLGAFARDSRTEIPVQSPGEAGAWLVIAESWSNLVRGAPPPGALEQTVKLALAEKRADILLEVTAVRALAELIAGDFEVAVTLSRRASRMARTESLPQQEYLANLTLARVRRLSGKPHLATRILGALLAVASKPWHPWLAWEAVFASGSAVASLGDRAGTAASSIADRAGTEAANIDGGARTTVARRSDRAPRELAALLDAARTGDRARFDVSASACKDAIRGCVPHERDLEALLHAIDPTIDLDNAPNDVRAFAAGESDAVPDRLLGVLGVEVAKGEPCAWVYAPRDGAPRRVLGPGSGLLRRQPATPLPAVDQSPQLRTDSAIALLVLAGREGLDEDVLFRRLYGFEYEPARHQAVRGVLYGRVRQRLGATVELLRDDRRVYLGAHHGLLVPDPRASPPPELRILQVLAERRRAAPKDVAALLDIPLRTAQDALRRLTDDGALTRDRAARGLHYILEDTTFSEPTRHGVRTAPSRDPHSV